MKNILTSMAFVAIITSTLNASILDALKIESGLSVYAVDNHKPFMGPNLGIIFSLANINFIFSSRATIDPLSSDASVQGLLTFEYEHVLSQVPMTILAGLSMGYLARIAGNISDGVLIQYYAGATVPLNQTLDVVTKLYGSFNGTASSLADANGVKKFIGINGVGIDLGFRFSFTSNWKLKY